MKITIGGALLVSAATTLFATGGAALAQDNQEQGEGKAAAPETRIVVTGSRIAKRDYEANSPIVTIDAQVFEQQAGQNVESYLNKLPEFNPAAAPTVGGQNIANGNGDVQISAVRSVGIATISLRGLGPNRNLVLVDGHRPTPINALMVTDTNGIPSALINRVETISGGASAVYGADAVGGVVNFILKKDYQGLQFDSQYGTTEAGDGQEFRISALAGSNFANDKGNVTLGVEHYSRSVAWERNRDFFVNSWSDPTVPGDVFIFGYNQFDAGSDGNYPSASAVNTIFANRPANTNIYARGSAAGNSALFAGFRFNDDGTMFTPGVGGVYRFQGPVDGHPYGYQYVYDTNNTIGRAAGTPNLLPTLKWNDPNAYVASPQTRYSMMASTDYKITDHLKFFARGTFAESKTKTLVYPAPISLGWEATIPYNPTKDSPLNPSLDFTNATLVSQILANPNCASIPTGGGACPWGNTSFIATGSTGAQHPVPTELAILLNSRSTSATAKYCQPGTPGCLDVRSTLNPALWGTPINNQAPWFVDVFPWDSASNRRTNNTNDVWQIETGLDGVLPFKDWTWEAYLSHGESSSYTIADGNRSLERWRELLAAPDYGRNANIIGNEDGVRINFAGGVGKCTSGYYATIFAGDAKPSQDCIDSTVAALQTRTQVQQNIGELNFEGALFNLPAGEVRAAVGFQYREDKAQFYPDTLESTNSYTDQVVGIYPTAALNASTSAQDYYVEAVVPVLANLPAIQKFELELGARYSTYSATDSTWTYKALADWSVTDWLRFRGGYNRASRAPNLGELYLNLQEIYVPVPTLYGDPCAALSNAPFGAKGAAPDPVPPAGSPVGQPASTLAAGQTAAGAASTYLICQAQMTTAGRDQFYGNPAVGAQGVAGSAGAVGALFNWYYQAGNPNLQAEEADTWTMGAVVKSPFDNPWLKNLSATIDWYKIDINHAIQQYSSDYARYLCYGANIVSTPEEAAAQAASQACHDVPRDPTTGGATTMLIRYDNLATIDTSGVDIAVNWQGRFDELGLKAVPGGIAASVQANVLDYYKTKASPFSFDTVIDWKGSLGPTLAGTNPGAYDYRVFTTLGYFLGDLSANIRWRHLPPVWSAAYAQTQSLIENGKTYTPPTEIKTKKYDVFDLSASYKLRDNLSLRFGIDNVLDTPPPRTGATAGYPYDPSKSLAENEAIRTAVCNGKPAGCTNPTAYSYPNDASGVTNGGFYDTLGRSYYVGIKLTY
jgi:outer membrane receptor protein involved in Fe transport